MARMGLRVREDFAEGVTISQPVFGGSRNGVIKGTSRLAATEVGEADVLLFGVLFADM